MEEDPYAPVFASPADKQILIVEDDVLIRDLLEMTLRTAGFQVIQAGNGLEAAKALESNSPHLIITDLMMPGQGGYEFLRSLQGSGGVRLPVVVVTASQLDASTVSMIRQEANVVEFISKPIRMNMLLAALHRHLRTKPLAAAPAPRGLNDR